LVDDEVLQTGQHRFRFLTNRHFKAHFSAVPPVSSAGISTVMDLGSAPAMARPVPSRPTGDVRIGCSI
jgi:hypothetical protein